MERIAILFLPVLLFSALSSISYSAELPVVDISKTVRSIVEIKKSQDFPLLDRIYSQPFQFQIAPELKNQDYKRIVERLNAIAFGNPDIMIPKECVDCNLVATHLETLIVYYDLNFLKTFNELSNCADPEDLPFFMFAHEIAHYLYELEVQRRGQSPWGQKGYFDVPERRNVGVGVQSAAIHGEVDTYGLILVKAARRDPTCALKFFDAALGLEASTRSKAEIQVRKEIVQKALKQILNQ